MLHRGYCIQKKRSQEPNHLLAIYEQNLDIYNGRLVVKMEL